MNYGKYVPILKWKRGEQVGLQRASAAVKAAICPVIEVVPIPWDYGNECPSKTLDAHLDGFGSKVVEYWGTEYSLFVDTGLLDQDGRMADGSIPLERILNDCRKCNVLAIPVLHTDSDNALLGAARKANTKDHRGFCIRLRENDLEDAPDRLSHVLSALKAEPGKCDLIVDLGYVEPGTERRTRIAITSVINEIDDINEWRTLTLCATAFPQNLSSISAGIETIPRSEWQLWVELLAHSGKISRTPSYGDYVISHPDLTDMDPRIMQMSANLRYTARDCWVIVKGKSVKKNGAEQMHTLCAQLILHPSYAGQSFSWGDKWIQDCADGTDGPGNAETWRRAGTNHHLTLVVDQISNLP